jgi:hypothetical protein
LNCLYLIGNPPDMEGGDDYIYVQGMPTEVFGSATVVIQGATEAIRTHGPLYSSSICPSQQDSLIYTQFSCTHPSSISSSIHSIHCVTHLSLYLNISMCDLVLKDLLRRPKYFAAVFTLSTLSTCHYIILYPLYPLCSSFYSIFIL